jgi:predicted anti-sigma-YlaC factor YlaD
MACPEFEDLIREGRQGHAAQCEDCRNLLDALAEVDATLESTFAGIQAPRSLAVAVQSRISREPRLRAPSLVPEILDFIGWAAVLALAVVLYPFITAMLS